MAQTGLLFHNRALLLRGRADLRMAGHPQVVQVSTALADRAHGPRGMAMYRRTLGVCFVTALALLSCRSFAASTPVTFSPSYSITNNNAGDVAIGLRQIHLTLTESTYTDGLGSTFVEFKFTNTAPVNTPWRNSSITDVWFDNGTYTQGVLADVKETNPYNPQIFNSDGVNFTRWADPTNPPGGETVRPIFDVTFSADAKSPIAHNGVDAPDEYVMFRWQLRTGASFTDAVRAVANGELRIAVKMQCYDSQGSETFIFVPTPTSALGGMGLLTFAGLSTLGARRKAKLSVLGAC
jgi:hypothetical protein